MILLGSGFIGGVVTMILIRRYKEKIRSALGLTAKALEDALQ